MKNLPLVVVFPIVVILAFSGLTVPPSTAVKRIPSPFVAIDFGNKYEENLAIGEVAAGDLDNNGIAEIVVETNEGPQWADHYINIFQWDGNKFVPRYRKSALELQGGNRLNMWIHGLAVGDFDGDGKKEIAINCGHDFFAIGWSGKEYQEKWRSKVYAGSIEGVADVDGDGCSDLITGGTLYTRKWVISLREGKFTIVWQSPKSPVGKPGSYAIGLLPGSTKPQLILTSSEVGKLLWQRYCIQDSPYKPLAEHLWDVSELEGFYYGAKVISDLDSDNTNEILALGGRIEGQKEQWRWTVWRWLPSGPKLLSQGPLWEKPLRTFAVGDVNGDRNLDIISVLFSDNTKSQTTVAIKILNWCGGKFVETWEREEHIISSLAVHTVDDVNGYGKNEIIADGDGKILIYCCRKVARAREIKTPSQKEGEVLVDEKPIFSLKTSWREKSAYERAKLVANRLDKMLEQDLKPNEVGVEMIGGSWCIIARGEVLVSIDLAESKAHGMSPKKLAEVWREKLEQALRD